MFVVAGASALNTQSASGSSVFDRDAQRRQRLVWGLSLVTLLLLGAGLLAGSEGWSWSILNSPEAGVILGDIRAPRTVGAWCVGALLGLGGAVAQGLFRNPLADPFLLGSAAGASTAVVLVLAASGLVGQGLSLATADSLSRFGLAAAAFVGALGGVSLTLLLARGAQHTVRLLLAGVVVGVVLGAMSDLLTTVAPEALRGKQVFMLGTTGFLGWSSVVLLLPGLLLAVPLAYSLSRVMDALTLGEETARSLGLPLNRIRLVLVMVLALATGLAVSQAGLVAFVGLVAPHLVRRFAPSAQGYTVLASSAMGGALLLAADVLARVVVAPQELPVGVLTALLGGSYLLVLLHRRVVRSAV
jgi:iron complex transport system permease protein